MSKRRKPSGMKTGSGRSLKKKNVAIKNIRQGGFRDLELKFRDSALTEVGFSGAAALTGGEFDPNYFDGGATNMLCLNGIAQGDGEEQRDGRRVVLKSIFVTGYVTQGPLVNQTVGADVGRVILALVHDKQTNGAQLNSEDVFKNPSGSTAHVAHLVRNLQYSQRFDVLWKKTYVMPPLPTSYDGTNMEMGETGIKFKVWRTLDLPVQFTGTGSTVASIADNSLHLIAFGSGAGLSLGYNARVRFIG